MYPLHISGLLVDYARMLSKHYSLGNINFSKRDRLVCSFEFIDKAAVPV
jgi:hypothetical protein